MARKTKSVNNVRQKIILETMLSEESSFLYHNLPAQWQVGDIEFFSSRMKMFNYQQEALKKIASALYAHYCHSDNLKEKYEQCGYDTQNGINRACFWMATGSGKTLVLIKTIEHINNLMSQDLIPKREIMLLFPREDLIKSFQKQIDEYNSFHGNQINLINLKDYEEAKNAPFFGNFINVYYYRSDILRDERKENLLNYADYIDNGGWYVFLDEAHRGDNQDSNLKKYVYELAQNGFMFNFSATFTDPIDIATTCFNFNLAKFTEAGYGKNILVGGINFKLKADDDEFSEREKQKQVLKSFIMFTLVKKSAKPDMYHNPLMITLGNTVNKGSNSIDSDLSMFCRYMLNIAGGKIDGNLFEEAKNGLVEVFSQEEKKYYFGGESIIITREDIKSITIDDLRRYSFNSVSTGALEYYKGEEGREIVLKLETADSPFALIKIGDADTFINNYLHGYDKLHTYATQNWFYNIDKPECTINILLGSRSFYEGWDSNRPNVINFINIGKKEAEKFVPQSIGRGIRIQPYPDNVENRKRLKENDKNKNKYLETLFVFPTDKKSIDYVLSGIKGLGEKTERKKLDIDIKLSQPPFPLLVPDIQETEKRVISSFKINPECKERFDSVFNAMSFGTFMLQSCQSDSERWSLAQYSELKHSFTENNNYNQLDSADYGKFDYLLKQLRKAIEKKEKKVKGVRPICGPDGSGGEENADIIHYEHIETDMDDNEKQSLRTKINAVNTVFTGETLTSLVREGKAHYGDDGCLYWADSHEKVHTSTNEKFNFGGRDINIRKISQHYYIPVIYAEPDSKPADFITHIIKQESEAAFVKNLIEHVLPHKINCQWMFSKIDESQDRICLPYVSDNSDYRNFFPDFIFWQKNGNRQKITFVDPKGTKHIDWQFKVQGFKTLFCDDNGQPLIFRKDNDTVEFDLKLVRNPKKSGQIPEEYKKWWVDNNDFKWLTEFN